MGTRIVLLLLSAAVLSGCPQFSPNVQITRELVYGAGYVRDNPFFGEFRLVDLVMDVLEPTDGPAAGRPAVVLVHGGSFTEGTREDEDLAAYADTLAAAGFVCFLIDYRLAGDNPPAPPGWDNFLLLENAIHAAFVDTKTAIRHVRAEADTYGIDPNRIAVMGESAGGFASVAAGVSEDTAFARDRDELPVPEENNPSVSARPQATLVLWGNAGKVIDDFSPDDPPMMIVHGEEDGQFGTPFSGAEAMRDACIAQGIAHEFYPLPGEDHGAWEAMVGRKTLATLSLDFLAEYLP
jgi:dienelactone hydrolase